MYVSVLAAYNASPEDFYSSLCPGIKKLGRFVYTHSIQAPLSPKLAGTITVLPAVCQVRISLAKSCKMAFLGICPISYGIKPKGAAGR